MTNRGQNTASSSNTQTQILFVSEGRKRFKLSRRDGAGGWREKKEWPKIRVRAISWEANGEVLPAVGEKENNDSRNGAYQRNGERLEKETERPRNKQMKLSQRKEKKTTEREGARRKMTALRQAGDEKQSNRRRKSKF